MSAPALTFVAPPWGDDDPETGGVDVTTGRQRAADRPPRPGRGTGRAPAATLRMTRGAREAAAGMKVSDAEIQRCLDAPDDVHPDDQTPSRTRFRRGALVVLAGGDGMVLRVDRRRR